MMNYIGEKFPQCLPIYRQIYDKKDLEYRENLDKELKSYAAEIGLDYMTNYDSIMRNFSAPPVIVKFFYNEQVKKSARKESYHSRPRFGFLLRLSKVLRL